MGLDPMPKQSGNDPSTSLRLVTPEQRPTLERGGESESQGSNLRLLAPKASILPLNYIPLSIFIVFALLFVVT